MCSGKAHWVGQAGTIGGTGDKRMHDKLRAWQRAGGLPRILPLASLPLPSSPMQERPPRAPKPTHQDVLHKAILGVVRPHLHPLADDVGAALWNAHGQSRTGPELRVSKLRCLAGALMLLIQQQL